MILQLVMHGNDALTGAINLTLHRSHCFRWSVNVDAGVVTGVTA